MCLKDHDVIVYHSVRYQAITMGYIYKIINKVSKKEYIGQTINLEERWHQHTHKKRSNCRYLKHAFNKYGIDNFEFKLVCVCFDEDMDKLEEQYIEKFNTLVPYGYNLRKGGNGGRHHEETKRKISLALKGRRTYDVSPWTGRHHSDKSKKLISAALKKRFATDEGRRNVLATFKSRPVVQVDKDNNVVARFESVKEASISLGISSGYASTICSGKRTSVKGFILKHADVFDADNALKNVAICQDAP